MNDLEEINKTLEDFNKENKTSFFVVRSVDKEACEVCSMVIDKIGKKRIATFGKVHKSWLLKSNGHPLSGILAPFIAKCKKFELEPCTDKISLKIQGAETYHLGKSKSLDNVS